MDEKPVTSAVGRSAMMSSAARLAWLSSTKEDHVKRTVALYLISTHGADSDLPPYAPLSKLIEVSGLQAAQLLEVLQGEAIFGVLQPGGPGPEPDANSVVYMNAETLVTRVYKEPGGLIPLPTADPSSTTTESSSALKPSNRQGTAKAPKSSSAAQQAAQSSKAINKRGRLYIADNMQLRGSRAAGRHATTTQGSVLNARAPIAQDSAGSAQPPATICSIPPLAVSSAIDPRLAGLRAAQHNNLCQLQGIVPAVAQLPTASVVPALMPSFWPVMTGPVYPPGTPLPQYTGAMPPGMLPSAYAVLSALAGASQAALLQQEYLSHLSLRQHELYSVPVGFPANSTHQIPSQSMPAAAGSTDALGYDEPHDQTTDSLEGDLSSLLTPAGMAAAGAAGVASVFLAADEVHATAGTEALDEVLQCNQDTNGCIGIDAANSAHVSPHPTMHMLNGCTFTKTQHNSDSNTATGLAPQHKACWGSNAGTLDDALTSRCTPSDLSASGLALIAALSSRNEGGDDQGKTQDEARTKHLKHPVHHDQSIDGHPCSGKCATEPSYGGHSSLTNRQTV